MKVAAVQAAPVFLDREATTDHAVALVEQAAAGGAELVVLPEAFVPGYPDWVWRVAAWRDGDWYARLFDQAVDIPGPVTERLSRAACDTGAWVAAGVTERSASGTLYNSLLYFSPAGGLAAVHRKLVLTGGERTVWGPGPAAPPSTVLTPFGRVGGLICWENYMPLARAAVYAQHVDVYLAPTWDDSETWVATLQHIAKEGRVYVIGINTCIREADVDRNLPGACEIYGGDGWMSRGRTAVVNPAGEIIAGPLVDDCGILYADLDPAAIASARQYFDPVGHYARPDVYELTVCGRPAEFAATG